jgi:protein-histidine pros-kinase
MGLTAKFNLILIPVLALGFAAIGSVIHKTLYDNAYHEVVEQAGLMMDSAMAVRGYTVDEIRPLLAMQIKRSFLPQTVPAYAATQSFVQLQAHNPEYSYKEATLNPTNPRDRAVDWEADIISMFDNHPELEEFVGERDTPAGRSLYLSRPIRIENEACLVCHSTPDAAPETMIERYGAANGFGWQLNEVVGAQIVSVPMGVPVGKADQTFRLFMAALAGIFLLIVLLVNLLLRLTVIKPLQTMSRTADAVSQGEEDVPEFDTAGKDELAVLATSFNRMRRSLNKAMDMLSGNSS